MNPCRYCGQPVPGDECAVTHAYWSGTKDTCHKACKVEGERAEAMACQEVDADCNDCAHYRRGKLVPPTFSQIRKPDGTTATVSHQTSLFVGGTCAKWNRPTLAQPKKWSGFPCFQHRRAEV